MTESPLPPGTIVVVDGVEVLLRPLSKEDKPRVREAFVRLSEESRYMRFWTPLQVLDEALLERLTDADGENHVAWTAQDPTNPEGPGFGAASFWRDAPGSRRAEFSITVADEYRACGIGTLLLAVLWRHAEALGIDELWGLALSQNNAVINWLTDVGADVSFKAGQCEFSLSIGEEAIQQIPHTLAGNSLTEWLSERPLKSSIQSVY